MEKKFPFPYLDLRGIKMTNEKWLNKLPKKTIIEFMKNTGNDLICYKIDMCLAHRCKECKKIWLKQEYDGKRLSNEE